jgi:hypothetical protein
MTARALLLVLFLRSLSPEASAAFRFRIPEGFRDLSPGLPDASFAGLPDAIVSEVRSGKYVAFAMDVREEDGFYENFNAIVQSGTVRIDEDFANGHKNALPAEYSKLLGGPVVVLEHGVTTLTGVTVLRTVYDVQNPAVAMRQLQYVVPGGNEEWATLTYTATPSTFDRYLPAFEASAAATEGAREAQRFDWTKVGKGALYGAGIGAVVGLILQLLKKREKPKPPPRRMPPRPVGRR